MESSPTYPASAKAETPLDLVVLGREDFTVLAESLGALWNIRCLHGGPTNDPGRWRRGTQLSLL
jgi:hypothetical protein